MTCPMCGNIWDASRNVCSHCGFYAPTPMQSERAQVLEEVRRNATQSGTLVHSGQLHQPGSLVSPRSEPLSTTRSLLPGTFLQGGRYHVQELLERQNWPSGAFEAMWTGRDLQQDKRVMICEIVTPVSTPAQTYALMRTAAMSLVSLRGHPHIVPLLSAFSDQGRCAFVFEHIDGESLIARLRRLQHHLPEQEVVEFCLQMTDILEFLGQKTPPLVHGLISPEHVYASSNGSQYLLGNFSILVAGGATQLLTDAGHSRIPPYTAPEFARGIIDTRNDLYSVLATAYHLVTGSVPVAQRGIIPPARSLNPEISVAFDALLANGLHFAPYQRYQHPSQLRQDLLMMRSQAANAHSFSSSLPPLNEPAFSLPVSGQSDFSFTPNASYQFPIAFNAQGEEEEVLLPAPETLPPMRTGNDYLVAALMLAVILCSLGIVTALSHFHV